MKVTMIFVEEMPESCGGCPFAGRDDGYFDTVCLAIEDKEKRKLGCLPEDMRYRRHDCPLQLDPNKLWKGEAE